jgi:chloramphenicol O-acetyltransferase type A
MKYIDLDTWDRKEVFTYFQSRANPRICITTNINVKDVVDFRESQSEKKHRFTDYVYYSIMKSANSIPEFRMRLVGLRPVEYFIVNAAFTYISNGSHLHSNCVADYKKQFSSFSEGIQVARNNADLCPTLKPAGGESQALIYMSCLPNIFFTSLSNPWGDPSVDTVPRIIFGKVDPVTKQMPLSIEVLHSFIDGEHISAFFSCMENIMSNPVGSFST